MARGVPAALLAWRSWNRRPALSRTEREDPGTLLGDGDRMFTMGRYSRVCGHDRPTVLEGDDISGAGIDHRLQGQNQAGAKFDIVMLEAPGDEIRYLRLLVHVSADAVADELLDETEIRGSNSSFDGLYQPDQGVSGLRLGDPCSECLATDSQRRARLLTPLPDDEGSCRVAAEALRLDADVDRDQVPIGQFAGTGDPMDHLLIDGDAGMGRKSVVSEKERLAAEILDGIPHRLIDLEGTDSGSDQRCDGLEGTSHHLAGDCHPVDLSW